MSEKIHGPGKKWTMEPSRKVDDDDVIIGLGTPPIMLAPEKSLPIVIHTDPKHPDHNLSLAALGAYGMKPDGDKFVPDSSLDYPATN
jgi:hypothetical protein